MILTFPYILVLGFILCFHLLFFNFIGVCWGRVLFIFFLGQSRARTGTAKCHQFVPRQAQVLHLLPYLTPEIRRHVLGTHEDYEENMLRLHSRTSSVPMNSFVDNLTRPDNREPGVVGIQYLERFYLQYVYLTVMSLNAEFSTTAGGNTFPEHCPVVFHAPVVLCSSLHHEVKLILMRTEVRHAEAVQLFGVDVLPVSIPITHIAGFIKFCHTMTFGTLNLAPSQAAGHHSQQQGRLQLEHDAVTPRGVSSAGTWRWPSSVTAERRLTGLTDGSSVIDPTLQIPSAVGRYSVQLSQGAGRQQLSQRGGAAAAVTEERQQL